MSEPRRSLVVTADDSTGATEAGAACADAGWKVVVAPLNVIAPDSQCVVVDLRSRHVAAPEARRRILEVTSAAHRVHKIDSTLRGNWAAELGALADAGRRIVLIPSHPPLGRVARGGVVLVDGVPVAETEHGRDPRMPVSSSRPGEQLRGSELAGTEALREWLDGDERVAIVDAETIEEIERLVAVANTSDVLIAGPASVVGAVAAAGSSGAARAPLPEPCLPSPIVAVCASLHPASRAQMAALVAAGIDVVMSPEGRGADSEAIAVEVAERAHRQVMAVEARSVILVGGDTAAAFIGDCPIEVFGSVDVGISLGEAVIRGRRLRLACKPGGFGTANTLVDLVNERSQP